MTHSHTLTSSSTGNKQTSDPDSDLVLSASEDVLESFHQPPDSSALPRCGDAHRRIRR